MYKGLYWNIIVLEKKLQDSEYLKSVSYLRYNYRLKYYLAIYQKSCF